jgi:hypothetical protein|nr:MAG TPA: hypothetical protein [Caudoviricetes sp.]
MKHIDIFQNGWNNLCNNQLAEIKALRDENLRLVNKNTGLETTCISLVVVLVLTLIFG